jgi:hypothetical protein
MLLAPSSSQGEHRHKRVRVCIGGAPIQYPGGVDYLNWYVYLHSSHFHTIICTINYALLNVGMCAALSGTSLILSACCYMVLEGALRSPMTLIAKPSVPFVAHHIC